MSKLHVGTSPISNVIFAGRLCRDGETWAGQPQDVTVSALVAVAEHVDETEGKRVTVTADGTPRWEITVRDLSTNAERTDRSAGSSLEGSDFCETR